MQFFLNNKTWIIPLALVALGIGIAFLFSIFGSQYFLTMDEKIAQANFQLDFDQKPILVGKLQFEKDHQIPTNLVQDQDQLLVTYLNSPQIDIFNKRFKLTETLDLEYAHPASISSIAVGNNQLFIGDQHNSQIRRYDKQGDLLGAWGWLPDQITAIDPRGMFYYQGILYVSDGNQNKLLAISVVEKNQISISGEMLYAKPLMSSASGTGSPEDMFITPDGRLLLADSHSGQLDVYSCMGDYYYTYQLQGPAKMIGPNAIALDNIPSPSLIARSDSIFDPSNVQYQGRVHITDRKTGRVKVFDNQGQYILTYGQELGTPEDIVIDWDRRIIIIADSELPGLAVYKY